MRKYEDHDWPRVNEQMYVEDLEMFKSLKIIHQHVWNEIRIFELCVDTYCKQEDDDEGTEIYQEIHTYNVLENYHICRSMLVLHSLDWVK